MQTIKTAVVVVLLLGVLYGVYIVLNTPEHELPGLEWPTASTAHPPTVDLGPVNTVTSPSHPGDESFPGALPEMEDDAAAQDPNRFAPPDSIGQDPGSPYANHQAGFATDAVPGGSGEADQPGSQYIPTVGQPARPSAYAVDASLPAGNGAGSDSAPPHSHTTEQRPGSPASIYAPPAESAAPGELPAAVTEQTAPSAGGSGSAAGDSQPTIGARAFVSAKRSATNQIERGEFREALFTLSIFYNSPDLTAEEQQTLLDMLDPLAGKVIYSTEHLLTAPHKVGRNENLFQVAEKHGVPWQLLANINGVQDPRVLVPGTELKVVPGPFRADVDLARGELTIFANRLYAGRFPISVGSDPSPAPGTYVVRDKQRDRAYYSASGRSYPARDPQNPFGSVWIDLGGELAIHGSPSNGAEQGQLGCIALSPRDANDVYGILSPGSKVLIR